MLRRVYQVMRRRIHLNRSYVTWNQKVIVLFYVEYGSYEVMSRNYVLYDRFHWNFYSPEIHPIHNLKFLAQIQVKPKSQFDFVPRDAEESEILDFVGFGGVAISVSTAIE